MRITVFGATGGIGGHVVRQALDAGHKVTAVVRQSSPFELEHSSLEVVRVPGLDEADPLRDAVDGSEAVISGVGPRGRKSGAVASSSTRSMLAAMTAAQVRRFVAVSAAPLGPMPPDESFLNRRVVHPMINAFAADVYADLRVMEADIMSSGTDWTIVRPPKLNNKPLTGTYRTAVGGSVSHGYFISRADVAHLMLAVLDDPTTVNQPVGVAY
ncbi:NAD(P)-dependent oxidoreductase [Kribbella pittospori]|uniref:NAD(P)-dependent oxidoreductase n=1 Tax=Kribbella pittospori TaxID=722689 RepID=A0A4R0KK97_9ACTN|nr:NAD(P)H-binding protein [Kribbella pittospori]TCC60157.1 NAD(P)-dependent oxidoreductase [Kribbella pittospori]